MLNKEEIEALELCVGIAIGEAGSGTQTDLSIEAIKKLKAAEQSVYPTVLPVREIEIICPNCNLVIDVPVPASHSG